MGEAITLSLAGEVDKENLRVPFQEERRWLYQQQNFRLHYFLVDFIIIIVIIYYHVQLFFKFFIPLFPVLARVSSGAEVLRRGIFPHFPQLLIPRRGPLDIVVIFGQGAVCKVPGCVKVSFAPVFHFRKPHGSVKDTCVLF